jgi:hypothetical protein
MDRLIEAMSDIEPCPTCGLCAINCYCPSPPARKDWLTPEEVEQIRKMARTPGNSLMKVAKLFGLDVGHVRYIKMRESR